MQKTLLSYDEEETFRKKLIALLLSGADKPIALKVNFQKELFLLIKEVRLRGCAVVSASVKKNDNITILIVI